jgi:putative transposase
METTVAMDYFTSKLVTLRGVVLAYSFVFIHHASRRVWISQPTLNPDEAWNINQLKGAVWWFEDQGIDIQYMIRDRDKKYSEKFDWYVKELTGVVRLLCRHGPRLLE